MGPIGVQELVVIFLVALVLFGPKKLPELGKTIAKAMTEFRRAQADLKATFDREMQSIERENESLKEATRQATIDITNYGDIDLMGETNGSSSTEPQRAIAPASDETHGSAAAPSPESHGSSAASAPTVSASEVPGAESHADSLPAAPVASPIDVEAAEATPGVEGTVPRSEVPEPAHHS